MANCDRFQLLINSNLVQYSLNSHTMFASPIVLLVAVLLGVPDFDICTEWLMFILYQTRLDRA